MRVLARIVYTLAGMALIAPTGARAGLPVAAGAPWSPARQRQASMESPADPKAPRLCADCQRSQLMAKHGVFVPPPPPLPPGAVVRKNACSSCGRPAAVVAGRLPRGRSSAMMADRSAPGRAVVGGESAFAFTGTGPVPIGSVMPGLAAAGGASFAGGPRDGSVMPASSPSDPVMPMSTTSPHVLSHLFGLSAIGRDRALARERRDEEKHARIAYGPSGGQPVQNVPASVVYGR